MKHTRPPVDDDLDAAIEHADDVGRDCGPCAAEHRQLAAWLRELKDRRAAAVN